MALFVCAFVALGDDRAEAEEVLASWYGSGFAGLPTASGERFDPNGFTAAHRTLPFGTQLLVSYRGYSVPVTVNDRGPYVGARELDLSRGAARSIGLTRAGVDYVDLAIADYGSGESSTTGGDRLASGYYAPVPDHPDFSTYTRYTTNATYVADEGYPETPSGGVYPVQRGDTLSGIAAELGTTVGALAAANGLPDPDVLYAGQTLYY